MSILAPARSIRVSLVGLALLVGSVSPLGLSACGGDDTIAEGGVGRVDPNRDEDFYVPLDSVREAPRSRSIVTRRDNPVLGGQVRLTDAEFKRVSDTSVPNAVDYCCERVRLFATGATFIDTGRWSSERSSAPFVSVRSEEVLDRGEREATVSGSELFLFRTPALLLDPGHAPATIRFVRGSSEFRPGLTDNSWEIGLRLASRVIVLPVHIHEFVSPSGNARAAWIPQQTRAAFEPPGVLTEGFRTRQPDGSARTIIRTRRWSPISFEPDRVWAAAEIQLRLASYETVVQDEGLERALISSTFDRELTRPCGISTRVYPFHQARKSQPGIHVYIGGEINRSVGGSPAPGHTCGAWDSCATDVAADRDDFILLDGGRQVRTSPGSISREVGHYLGLANSTETRPCGRSLLGDPDSAEELADNMMNPSSTDRDLSPAQIARARAVACSAFATWGPIAGFDSSVCR